VADFSGLAEISCQNKTDIPEVLIGVLFGLIASPSIRLLADNPHVREHLKDLLVRQILWVDYPQPVPIVIVYALVLVAWFALGRRVPTIGFSLVFSIAITASVQLATALSIGLLAYCVGIGQSMLFDYPNGALILGAMALFANAWTCSLPRPSLLAGLAGSEATSP
jgi:zinc/manganese transport system permease protein